MSKLILFAAYAIFAGSLIHCASSDAKAPMQKTPALTSPELAFSSISMFAPVGPYIGRLTPYYHDTPKRPTKAACAEEYSDCAYQSADGVIYHTNGIVFGQMDILRQGQSWNRSLPWGLESSDTPSIVVQKLRARRFLGVSSVDSGIYAKGEVVSMDVKPVRPNQFGYMITILFDETHLISEISARGYDW